MLLCIYFLAILSSVYGFRVISGLRINDKYQKQSQLLQPNNAFITVSANLGDDILMRMQSYRRSKDIKALFSAFSYMSIICGVMSLPATLRSIDKAMVTSSSVEMSFILLIATLGTVVGKFLLGPPTDKLGGELMLKISLFAIALILIGCSFSNTIAIFGGLWILLSFVFGAGWGAVSQVIRRYYPQNEWGNQLGSAAACSRMGSLVSSQVYGFLMSTSHQNPNSWRIVYRSAALFQLLILSLFHLLPIDTIVVEEKNTEKVIVPTETCALTKTIDIDEGIELETIPQVLRHVAGKSSFWFMLLSKVALMTVGQFISFITLYLSTGLGKSDSIASKCSGVFAFGSLICNLFGTKIYQRMNGVKQHQIVILLNIWNCILPGILTAQAMKMIQLPFSAVLMILSIWGATWALPFYIPAGVFALRIGGLKHAALITNLMDAAGYISAAFFSKFAMDYGRLGQWDNTLASLTICGVLALLGMFVAMLDKDMIENNNDNKKT